MKKQNRQSSARRASGGKAGKRKRSTRKPGKSLKRSAGLKKFVQTMNELNPPSDSKDSPRR